MFFLSQWRETSSFFSTSALKISAFVLANIWESLFRCTGDEHCCLPVGKQIPNFYFSSCISRQLEMEKKKKGGLFRSANVSLYELTLAQAGTEGPEEMSYTFLGSCRLFMTGYWHNVAEENLCQTCQRVQWTCGRDLDPWGRPGDTEEARGRASTWLNLSSINLWVVSAAGCVTHSSSLLWSVLICYWLNTLRYFMYLSASSFGADLYHPSQELEQEAKGGFWICGKCIFRLFSTVLLLESLLPELAGHISAVWLRVPAAALSSQSWPVPKHW